MSGEESFVILGSSPTESMENYSIIQKISKRNEEKQMLNSSKKETKEPGQSLAGDVPSNVWFQETSTSDKNLDLEVDGTTEGQEVIPKVVPIENLEQSGPQDSLKSGTIPKNDLMYSKGVQSIVSQHSSLSESKKGSLAASFLLGEVDLDVLKANVFSQFPSLCGPQANPDDIIKLQNFMTEYVELKDNMQKTNTFMRQHFAIMQKWQNEISVYKEQQQKQIKECHELIAKLRNENMELKKELNTKIEQIQINEKVMKKENEDLVKLISEKSSIIENMGVQIDKLEQSQYPSFEYVKRSENEKDYEHEYIRVSDHKTVIKGLERKLSEVTAEKLELEDMKKVYIDEINCLKVNLTAAEELLKKNQADISVLKSKDVEKSELFEKYEKEKDEMKQEMNLLRAQLDVYCKDFELERIARQNLAGEKEQLLTDLKMLQRRNQQLIEEASIRLDKESRREVTSTTTLRKRNFGGITTRKENDTSSNTKQDDQVYTRSNFVCPLCNNNFKCLDTLQVHVQDCLDKA